MYNNLGPVPMLIPLTIDENKLQTKNLNEVQSKIMFSTMSVWEIYYLLSNYGDDDVILEWALRLVNDYSFQEHYRRYKCSVKFWGSNTEPLWIKKWIDMLKSHCPTKKLEELFWLLYPCRELRNVTINYRRIQHAERLFQRLQSIQQQGETKTSIKPRLGRGNYKRQSMSTQAIPFHFCGGSIPR